MLGAVNGMNASVSSNPRPGAFDRTTTHETTAESRIVAMGTVAMSVREFRKPIQNPSCPNISR